MKEDLRAPSPRSQRLVFNVRRPGVADHPYLLVLKKINLKSFIQERIICRCEAPEPPMRLQKTRARVLSWRMASLPLKRIPQGPSDQVRILNEKTTCLNRASIEPHSPS